MVDYTRCGFYCNVAVIIQCLGSLKIVESRASLLCDSDCLFDFEGIVHCVFNRLFLSVINYRMFECDAVS